MKTLTSCIVCFLFVTLSYCQVVPTPITVKSNRQINNEKEDLMINLFSIGIDTSNYYNTFYRNDKLLKTSVLFKQEKKRIDSVYSKQKSDLTTWRIDTVNKIRDRMNVDPNYRPQGKLDKDKVFADYRTKKEDIITYQYDEYETVYNGWEEDNWFRLFPARNRVCGALYYKSRGDKAVESLKNGFLKFDESGGSVYEELIAGYGGPFRFSFGGMIAVTKLVTIDTAALYNTPTEKLDSLVNSVDSINRVNNSIQRLIGGGGNSIFVISTPIFDIHDYRNYFRFSTIAFDKLCFDIPSLGYQLTNVSVVNGLGFETNASYSLASENPFGFFASFRMTFLKGTSQFYENLGLLNSNILTYSELNIGFYLYQFRIFYNKNWINETTIQDKLNWTIGVSLIPFRK